MIGTLRTLVRPDRPALRPRLTVAVLAAAAGLALTGCQPAKAGAAVIIDGERVPVSVVQDKVEAVAAARAARGLDAVPHDVLAREQIQRLIGHQIAMRTAAQRGVTVTPGDIDQEIAAREAEFGGPESFQDQVAAANIAPGDLRTFVQDYLSMDALRASIAGGATTEAELVAAQQELNKLSETTARGMNIRVNPRYGSWDPATGEIKPSESQVSVPDQGVVPPTPGQ
ncbi:MAG: hypothetical protein L0Y54_12205 [Sporichthyaceae bacterium]|nr:hypothetical protein [Sporichthyaceae bacterium]